MPFFAVASARSAPGRATDCLSGWMGDAMTLDGVPAGLILTDGCQCDASGWVTTARRCGLPLKFLSPVSLGTASEQKCPEVDSNSNFRSQNSSGHHARLTREQESHSDPRGRTLPSSSQGPDQTDVVEKATLDETAFGYATKPPADRTRNAEPVRSSCDLIDYLTARLVPGRGGTSRPLSHHRRMPGLKAVSLANTCRHPPTARGSALTLWRHPAGPGQLDLTHSPGRRRRKLTSGSGESRPTWGPG